MVYRWCADDCLLIVVLGSSLPSSTKKKQNKRKKTVKVGPLLQNYLNPHMHLHQKVSEYDQEMPQSHIAEQL